ncbi:RHS repeat-associated core domain-containing protein [Pseudomonas sp. BW16M2]|nr:RHS repeat-associated core domain-containing protein [Pseudomonas sp. BW16M2]
MARECLLATDRSQSPHSIMTSSGRLSVAYTPYGLRPAPEGSSITGFTGQLREVERGWYLLGNGHRVFCPSLMRFLSADVLSPFGRGGVNCYAYCLGDPVNKHDRGGRRPRPHTTLLPLETSTPGGYGFSDAMNDYAGFLPAASGIGVLFASWWLKQPFSRTSVGSVVTGVLGGGLYTAGRSMEALGQPSGSAIATSGVVLMNIGGTVATGDGLRSMWRNRPGAQRHASNISRAGSASPSSELIPPPTPSASSTSSSGSTQSSKQKIAGVFAGGVLQRTVDASSPLPTSPTTRSVTHANDQVADVRELESLINNLQSAASTL